MASEQRGWVIEAGASPNLYWDGRAVNSFKEDHLEAVRFSRFEDAERVRCWLLLKEQGMLCRSIEHLWSAEGA